MAKKMSRQELEAYCSKVGQALKGLMPEDVGFTLMMFNFGHHGSMAYMSTSQRDDMIEAMEEMIRILRGGLQTDDGVHRKP